MTTEKYQPIQTEYNGHIYRSRLEARWAVLMNCIKTDFEPEPEIFQVEINGFKIQYQPDFVIYDLQNTENFIGPLYVEVKGVDKYEDIYLPERMKIEAFAEDHALLVLGNMPYRVKDLPHNPGGLFSFQLINGANIPCFFNTYNGVPWLVDYFRVINDPERINQALYFANKAIF